MRSAVNYFSASCQKRRGGNETMELYSSVGFYKNQICKYTGICDKADSYNKYHKGYIRTQYVHF